MIHDTERVRGGADEEDGDENEYSRATERLTDDGADQPLSRQHRRVAVRQHARGFS